MTNQKPNFTFIKELAQFVHQNNGKKMHIKEIQEKIGKKESLNSHTMFFYGLQRLGQKYETQERPMGKMKDYYFLLETNKDTNDQLNENPICYSVGSKRRQIKFQIIANFISKNQGKRMSIREIWENIPKSDRVRMKIGGTIAITRILKAFKIPIHYQKTNTIHEIELIQTPEVRKWAVDISQNNLAQSQSKNSLMKNPSSPYEVTAHPYKSIWPSTNIFKRPTNHYGPESYVSASEGNQLTNS